MRKLVKIIKSTPERHRLVVSRSNYNVYAQIVDDEKHQTIAGLSSMSLKKGRANVEISKVVGKEIAKLAMEKGVKKVVFDRAGKLYHGRIKAVAEGAREQGLEF